MSCFSVFLLSLMLRAFFLIGIISTGAKLRTSIWPFKYMYSYCRLGVMGRGRKRGMAEKHISKHQEYQEGQVHHKWRQKKYTGTLYQTDDQTWLSFLFFLSRFVFIFMKCSFRDFSPTLDVSTIPSVEVRTSWTPGAVTVTTVQTICFLPWDES